MVKVSKFDVVDYLDSEEMIEEYLKAVQEEKDPELLRAALSDVVKARAAAQLAKDNSAQQS